MCTVELSITPKSWVSQTLQATSTCSVPTSSTWNNTGRTIQFGSANAAVFLDSSDTAYITDNDGNQIFKLLKGTINATIIANATKPADVVVDTSGNVYIAQASMPQILKLWTNGTISTFTNVSYGSFGLAIDSSNNIYISDTFANSVLKLSSTGSGNATVVAGGNGYGNASNQLQFPCGLAVDASGSLYIADFGNGRIQKWVSGAMTGTILIVTLVSIFVTVDCNNYLYVSNGTNILRFPPNSTIGTTVISELNGASSMKLDSEVNMYVVDTYLSIFSVL
ncbi:unnamed protein product [Didymodactylos carnosus]|uniref:SMP-30/Gluconolactonase/LRE-like region domain-containing protein n=1 Tax=Didymodactylos carnosus TaxID=1234261 RepID=A0A8S2N4X3_9BILA|nr:unnamed protein product [Didymodactylos carnosus]CAF3986617.1 unnamed protein product [Didymodactylos carnosus]